MKGYVFDLACPSCGEDLTHRATGNRYSWQQAAVAHCVGCRRDYIVNVTLSLASAKDGLANALYEFGRSRVA